MVAKETTSTPQASSSGGGATPRSKTPARGGGDGKDGARRLPSGGNRPSILTFFQESRSELRKVTWPSRQETINLTTAVIAMTIAIAAFLGLIDQLLNLIVQPLIGTS